MTGLGQADRGGQAGHPGPDDKHFPIMAHRPTVPARPRPSIVVLAIVGAMPTRSEIFREVMLESRITQSELSRVSGVRQPSISQYLSGGWS